MPFCPGSHSILVLRELHILLPSGSSYFLFPTWQTLTPFVLLLPFPSCKLPPSSYRVRDPAGTPFPTFPSLQLSLLIIPGAMVVNKLTGDHLVPGAVWTQPPCFGGKQIDGSGRQTFHSTWPPNRETSRACFIWWPFALPPSPALLCYFEGLMCLSPMLFSSAFSQISVLGCIINTSECSKIIRHHSTENYVIGLNIGRLKIIPFRLLLLPLRDFLAGEERF